MKQSFFPTSLKSRHGWVRLFEAQQTDEPHLHQIEPTNHCPYACVMCPRDKHMTRETGFMELDLYQKVIEEVSGYSEPVRSREIELFHFGESLLHPKIDEMIVFGSSRNLNMTLSVNAPHLTPPLAERVLASNPCRLIISLDGHDDETYRKIRGPVADYQKAKQNIQSLISLVEQGGAVTQICVRIIRLHDNDPFVDQFRKEWEARGIKVEVRPFFPWTDKEMVDLGRVEKYPPYMPCSFPWQYLVVQWDGSIVPCCRDYNGTNTLGNVRNVSLKQIWNSPAYHAFREQHLVGNYASNKFCKDCMDIFYTEEDRDAVIHPVQPCPECLARGNFSVCSGIQEGVEINLHDGFAKKGDVILPLSRRQSALLFVAQRRCCLQEVLRKTGLSEQALWAEFSELLAADMIRLNPQDGVQEPAPAEMAEPPIETLGLLWQKSLAGFSERPLLVSDDDNSCFKYEDADEIITMLKSSLAAAGVRKGDRVVAMAPQHAELFFLFWATTSLGAVFVPLDPKLPGEAAKSLLHRVEPKLLFVDYSGFKNRINVPDTTCIVLDDADDLPVAGAKRFSEWLEQASAPYDAPVELKSDDMAVLLFTSGTTGQPKGVELSHVSLCRSASLMAATYAWRDNDVLLSLGDFHTMSGLRNPCLVTVVSGCSLVLAPPEARANALVVADCIERNRVTLLCTVPAMLRQFSHFADRVDQETMLSLRRILCTGSSLLPDLAAKIRKIYRIPVFNYYGLTETSGLCAGVVPGDLDRAAGSIGVPLGCLMRIEAADGSAVAPGERGDLLVFTENLMLGYYQDPAMTKQVVEDGWYRTGDLAYRDDSGFVFLTGRLSDAIKDVRGELVYPQEVEAVIDQSGMVKECGVCGVTGAEGDERLVAFVVLGEEIENEGELFVALSNRIQDSLGACRVPSRYHQIKKMPRGVNGKLLRNELKKLL